MKIAVIGASGSAGSLILGEALARGYEVVAVVRDKKKLNLAVDVLEKDVFSLEKNDLKDFDVVVNALGFFSDDTLNLHKKSTEHLLKLLQNEKTRLIFVGGAGSLYVDNNKTQLKDTQDFPEEFYPLASAMSEALDVIRAEKNVQWTYFSPAADFDFDGEKTGEYVLGGEEFFLNEAGDSYISYKDYAKALVDEIENKKFINKRFTAVKK